MDHIAHDIEIHLAPGDIEFYFERIVNVFRPYADAHRLRSVHMPESYFNYDSFRARLIDLAALVRAEYEEMKPVIIAAALSRMAVRAGVAEGVRAAGRQSSNALGDALSILIELFMVATDKPDPRSWTMLPARVLVARVPVDPSSHEIDISFAGTPAAGRQVKVDVSPGRSAVVVVTEPR